MDFVNFKEFLDDVLPEVPGCSLYTALDRVRWSAIEFCKQTGVSVETNEELDIEADEAVIDVPSPASYVQPWQVLWVQNTQGTVRPLDRRTLAENGVKWKELTSDWPPEYVRLSRNQIRLVGIPENDHDEALTIHASYIPVPAATKVDVVLLQEYREAIVSGALSRLLNMSKERWHDRAESIERRDQLAIAISGARALADKDFTTGEQTVQMNPMA